jgi:rod shape-determining protein MreC
MRNIWLLFSKYNAFFLLIIYFIFSLILLIRNNSFQRASVWNSSNKVIGEAYQQVNEIKSYLSLGSTNDSLAAENALLRNQLTSSFKSDSIKQVIVRDSTLKQQYTYTLAKVINNSINRKNNYLTINRGTNHGIVKGMGVTSAKGIVGIVWNVSENFATIRSILHSDTKVSAQVNGNIGSLVWGEGNNDSRYAYLKDVQSHLKINKGDKVLSSEFSLFPEGTTIGYVVENRTKGGTNDLDIKVKLSTDFSALQYQYVYVINNLLSGEQVSLESLNKIE